VKQAISHVGLVTRSGRLGIKFPSSGNLESGISHGVAHRAALTIGSRPERDALNGRTEPISVSPLSRYDRRRKGIAAQLPAEPVYSDINGSIKDVSACVRDTEQILARQRAARRPEKGCQQGVFNSRQANPRSPGINQLLWVRVELPARESVRDQSPVPPRQVTANHISAEDGAYSSQQLPRAEWRHQAVIRAKFQADDAVRLVRPCRRNHDHRDIGACANFLQKTKSIGAEKRMTKQYQGWGECFDPDEGTFERLKGANVNILSLQMARQVAPQFSVVIDDKKPNIIHWFDSATPSVL
jgi:hypothetical protein